MENCLLDEREQFSKRMKIAQAFNVKLVKRVVEKSKMNNGSSDLLLLGTQELDCIGQNTAESAE